MRAIGLDLSLARTGVALATGQCRSVATTIPTKATPTQRAERLHQIVLRLDSCLRHGAPTHAVIEGYAGMAQGNTAARLGELHGAVLVRCVQLGMEVIEVAPSVLKKYSTGNGGADKPAMIAAAESLGAKVADDDQADAFLLRQMALDYGELRKVDFRREASPREWAAYQFDVLLGWAS